MRTFVTAFAVALTVATAGYAQPLTGQQQTIAVVKGDTLRSLGSRFGIDPATIARDNSRTVDAPLAVGETLRLDNRHILPAFPPGTTILINVPQRMLFFSGDNGVTAFPVATGRRDWPTPIGQFLIMSKEVNPTWDVPESIRDEARLEGRSLPLKVPPGPDNPLGAYWLGLSIDSLGIHGTNAPSSVYRAVTHGCLRLHPSDIKALFPQLEVGARGALIYQPILVAVDGQQVFMEAHRDVYGRGPRDPVEFVRSRARELGAYEQIDWAVAAQVLQERAGLARLVTR